jgi:DNA-binding MarR family transcriptional regulator
MSPFKNEDILAIREAYKNGESQRSIADRLNVSQSSISAIVTRKTWIHI